MEKNNNNNLDFLSKCYFCGETLGQSDLTILENKEKNNIFHITCQKCKASAIVYFSVNQSGIVSVGVATDLDKQEVKEKFLQPAVSADEVIDAHEFISSYQGNWKNFSK